MNDNYNLYSIDNDSCPENDAIIYQKMYSNCEYYEGFELYLGHGCIRCSYYQRINKQK